MKGAIVTAVTFVVLAIFLATADAAVAAKPFSCFTCENCGDPFISNATKLIESKPCAAGINRCYKFFHSDKKIQRGCAPNANTDCPEDKGGKLHLTFCYTCYNGDCNSGRRMSDVSILTISAAALSSILGGLLWKKF